jgi:hypothetical protein
VTHLKSMKGLYFKETSFLSNFSFTIREMSSVRPRSRSSAWVSEKA